MLDKFKVSRVLQVTIQVGVFFILFSPLVVNNLFFFPFIVPRNVFFRIFVELIFFSWLLLMQVDPRFRPDYKKWNKLVWLVIGFFVVNVISTIFSIGIYSSFWSNYERMGGLFHMAHLLMLFLVIIHVFKTKKQWYSILSFSLFVSMLMSFLAFSQWLEVPFLLKSSGGKRLTATVGNAAFLAAYLLFNVFIALYFLLKSKDFSLKVFINSFLAFDIFLVVSSIFNSLWAGVDWGFFNFLKAPLLAEAFKVMANKPISSGNFLYTPEQSSAALVLVGVFILSQIGLVAAWYFRHKAHVNTALILFIALFESFILFNTQTRGAIIGLFLGFIFLSIITLIFSSSKKIKQFSLGFMILAILAPFILLGARDTSFVKSNETLHRLATISLTDITTESRLLTWQASWKGMTESPKSFLIGYGTENYYYAFNKNFPVAIFKDAGSRIWFDRAHNIIFDVGVTTGIIGLIIYLSIFVYATILLFKRYRTSRNVGESFLLIALLIAYFVQNFFVFDTLNTDILFYLFLGLILFIYSQKDIEDEEEVINTEHQEPNYFYFGTVVMVFIVGIFFINIRTLSANHDIYSALTKGQVVTSDSPSQVVDKAQIAFDYFKSSIDNALPGRFEARQQFATYVNGLKNRTTNRIPDDKLIPMINYAGSELIKTVEEEPSNVRHYIYLATFYNATTQYNRSNPQKVIDLMKKAIKLSPTRPHLYYEMGQAYAYQGNYDESVKAFEKAVSLAPTVRDGQMNILTINIVFKKFEEADRLFEFIKEEYSWEPEVDDYKYLVSLYGRVENVDKMIEYQTIITQLEPNFDNYAQLAAIYGGDNKAEAIAAAEKAITLTSDAQSIAEAQAFIDAVNSGQL